MPRLPHHPRLGRPFKKCETQENIKICTRVVEGKEKKRKDSTEFFFLFQNERAKGEFELSAEGADR